MPLSPGDQLGPYGIIALVGQGGMGEVYRAYDDRLRRDVAIKVSNSEFTDRFALEARAIAALNHTNICHLYDVGPNFLVMEYVKGEDLNGPLDFDDALPILQQLIDGIEAAHEKDIVHRDLKPANIKITPEGIVKILDFGLAKTMATQPSSGSNPENSPTLTIGATAAGTILGTAAYMAPEQAKGKQADRRSDIWSFGVILYEVLTGKKLFTGETAVEILGGVLNQDPDISAAPPRVHKLLRWCLEKDRRQRLASISDARRLLSEPDADTIAKLASASQVRFGRLPWIAAAVMTVVAGFALWALWRATQPADRPLMRLDVDLGADVSLPAASTGTNVAGSSVAVSPDGMRLVYISGNPRRLFTRRLDQPKSTELVGTQGAYAPFFSPDGQWIGFKTGNTRLSKIAVEGGAVFPLGDFETFSGTSWGEDGSILLGVAEKGIIRVLEGGRQPEVAVPRGSAEFRLSFPQILPGGKAILFSAITTADSHAASIDVMTLADRHRNTVLRGSASPRYLATSNGIGHLVYLNNAMLYAVPFDPDKLEIRGTALPIVDDVASNPALGAAQVSFSSAPSGHGTLVYRRANSGGASAMMTLRWVTPSGGPTGQPAGKEEPLLAKPGGYRSPRLSPDGKRVALTVTEGGTQDIWVYDPQRDAMTRLTFGGGTYRGPVWSPDGQYVVFESRGKGIFQARSDGAGQPQVLTENKVSQVPWSFTPDGKRLAYFELAGDYQIWTVPLEEQGGRLKAGKPEQFLKSSFSDSAAAFSPDGRWLAYSSNESGKDEVYVRAFPPPSSGQGGKWQISNSGGTVPVWSRSGHELIYQSGDQILAASYTVRGDTLVMGKPRVWIAKLGLAAGNAQWDLAPDGKRVAVLTPVESEEAPKQDHEIVILLNFFDELRRKVPVGK